MSVIREKWDKLPRPARAAIIFVVGAAPTLATERGISSPDAPRHGTADNSITYPVGVTCSSDTESVEYWRAAHSIAIQCVGWDGTERQVQGMAELVTDSTGQPFSKYNGYTGVIKVPGNFPNSDAINGVWCVNNVG